MKRKLSIKKIFIYLIIPVLIIAFLVIGMYAYSLRPVSDTSKEVSFEVKQGDTYSSIAEDLKEKDLIRSVLSFKILIKIKSTNHLEAGYYKLNKNMSASEILEYLESGVQFNPNIINITIPEGKNITEIAKIIANTTGKDFNTYLNYWNSEEFKDKVIEKYWFVTDLIKDEDVRYGLEGYFFPSTYELQNKDVSAEYIAYRLLDQMNVILTKYKTQIESSKYKPHQLLALASIVEYEAVEDIDRPLIAGVFYNRLKANMKLQSDVTVWYAIGEKKLKYTSSDLKTDSPYNTYYYSGIPAGPVNNPGEESIKAVLNPTSSDYYYFLADICSKDNKTYYAKTYSEHKSNAKKYLTCV